jgi:hypothetical protein
MVALSCLAILSSRKDTFAKSTLTVTGFVKICVTESMMFNEFSLWMSDVGCMAVVLSIFTRVPILMKVRSKLCFGLLLNDYNG